MAPRYTLGWVYNLTHEPHTSRAECIIGFSAALTATAVLCVALRLATRRNNIGLDDIAVSFSAILSVAYTSLSIYQTRWGLGLISSDFPDSNAIPFSKIQYAGGPVYCLAILGFKVSLLSSYLRFADGFSRRYTQVLYAIMALVVLNSVAYVFALLFACHPIAKQWNSSLPGTCINEIASYYGLAGSSLGFDVLIICLPFPFLRRLTFDIRKKLALAFLCGLGFFVTVIQIVRILKISALVNYTDSRGLIVWSIAEINVGIVIACVTSFAPLLASFGQKIDRVLQDIQLTDSDKYSDEKSYGSSSEQKAWRSSRIPDLVSATDGDDLKLRPKRLGASHSWIGANAGSTESIVCERIASEYLQTDGLALPPLDNADDIHRPNEIYVSHKVKVVRDPYSNS